MDTLSTPNPANPIPSSTYWQLAHTLRGILPAPAADDSAEEAALSEPEAINHAASLLPATPEEANFAAQYVAASAWALDCLRLARTYPNDSAHFLKCTSQSSSMSRQALRWRAALQRAQAERRRQEADPAARDPAPPVHAVPAASAAAEPAQSNPTAEAERYALLHRKRAVLIRRLGRLPEKTNIGWLPPQVVHAIATGTTPILLALDEKPQRHAALAA